MSKLCILSMGLLLAGCVSSTGGLSQSQIAALPLTANMPTGSANFTGKISSKSVVVGASLTENFDFNLAANFDAKTVRGTATNYSASGTQGTNTIAVRATGSVIGDGTITGNSFTIPKVSGTLTPTSATINGVEQTLPGPTTYTATAPISGNFVGDNAQAIYGTGAVSGGTYEFYGNKQ